MFKKIIQVGFVTRELDRILKNLVNIYNIGPWYLLKFSPENVKSMKVYGKKQKYSMNVAVCPIGDTRFEYIEPISESIFSDFNNSYGENVIHHLKFGVKSYRDALQFLDSKNIKIIQVGHQQGDKGKNMYNFLDTQEEFGFITEVVHVTKNFIKPQPDLWYPSDKNNLDPVFIKPSVIGIVVKNIEDKIRKYEEFQIGPWQAYDFGKESNLHIKVKMAFCRIDNIVLKLIEPQSDSIFSDHLLKHGEGIHHLKMEVADYDKTLKSILSRDYGYAFF
ncbi:MAG: VOC family protein [Candidatus Humimicrobiaceae bacterium]